MKHIQLNTMLHPLSKIFLILCAISAMSACGPKIVITDLEEEAYSIARRSIAKPLGLHLHIRTAQFVAEGRAIKPVEWCNVQTDSVYNWIWGSANNGYEYDLKGIWQLDCNPGSQPNEFNADYTFEGTSNVDNLQTDIRGHLVYKLVDFDLTDSLDVFEISYSHKASHIAAFGQTATFDSEVLIENMVLTVDRQNGFAQDIIGNVSVTVSSEEVEKSTYSGMLEIGEPTGNLQFRLIFLTLNGVQRRFGY